MYLDARSPPIVVGYDFWGPNNRTKVVTWFFAHQAGAIEGVVFEDFECLATEGGEGMGAGGGQMRSEM